MVESPKVNSAYPKVPLTYLEVVQCSVGSNMAKRLGHNIALQI